ncbi:hypothetical protein C9374_011555 [Naegleria lovaniensis]|uniref:F-box domain-containing protein n=1 Tax=Naegleria lovaniensis TaxID=51637 RepID=A0AA88KWU3_NAELO|nr:uncharacterized protein C9374_011555 [Naegleria lovaniensis]KAG2392830.1 hypothetical protein C9374_011555 [Naegleria lovaniensis]
MSVPSSPVPNRHSHLTEDDASTLSLVDSNEIQLFRNFSSSPNSSKRLTTHSNSTHNNNNKPSLSSEHKIFNLPSELIILIQTFLPNHEKQLSRFISIDWNLNYYQSVTVLNMSKRMNSRVYVIDFLKMFSRLQYVTGNVNLQLEHVLQLQSSDLRHVDGLFVDSIPQLYSLIRAFPRYETVALCYDIFRKTDMLETQLPQFVTRFMKDTLRKITLQNVYVTHKDLLYIFEKCPNLSCLDLHSNLDMRYMDNFRERSEKRPPIFNLKQLPKGRLTSLSLHGKKFEGIADCIENSHRSLQELTLQCGGALVSDLLGKMVCLTFPELRVLKIHASDLLNDEAASEYWIALFKACPRLEYIAITKAFRQSEFEAIMMSCPYMKRIEVDGFENDACLDLCRTIVY